MTDDFVIAKEKLEDLVPPEYFKTEKGLEKFLQRVKKIEYAMEDLIRDKAKIRIGKKKVILQTIERPLLSKELICQIQEQIQKQQLRFQKYLQSKPLRLPKHLKETKPPLNKSTVSHPLLSQLRAVPRGILAFLISKAGHLMKLFSSYRLKFSLWVLSLLEYLCDKLFTFCTLKLSRLSLDCSKKLQATRNKLVSKL